MFVPRTAPGDVVEAELVERKPTTPWRALLPCWSHRPDRQIPACPNYETAGCCHWQHIRYSRQLEIKEAILRETLQRTGRITWDAPIPLLSGPDLALSLSRLVSRAQAQTGIYGGSAATRWFRFWDAARSPPN